MFQVLSLYSTACVRTATVYLSYILDDGSAITIGSNVAIGVYNVTFSRCKSNCIKTAIGAVSSSLTVESCSFLDASCSSNSCMLSVGVLLSMLMVMTRDDDAYSPRHLVHGDFVNESVYIFLLFDLTSCCIFIK